MKDQTTECATGVGYGLKDMIARLWFQATALYPRRLPVNEKQIQDLKQVLTQHFGLKDDPRTWATVFGQMTSVPPTSIRKPYAHYVNVGKRLYINETIQGFKMLEIGKLQSMLEEKLREAANDKQMPEGPHDHQGELPSLSPLEEGMV